MSPRSGSNSIFGLELQKLMVSRGLNASSLSRKVSKTGHKISPQFVSMMVRGVRRAHPPSINAMSDAMQARQSERHILHRAAALDFGFDIGGIHL